jgi:hypothetical protein
MPADTLTVATSSPSIATVPSTAADLSSAAAFGQFARA